MVAPCSEIAPDGTLVVYTESNGPVRVDPFTGAQSALPSFLGPASASGQRSFMANPGGGGTLYEPDGSTVAIDLLPPPSGGLGYYTNYGSPYAFFGEDFYYVSSQAALIRFPALRRSGANRDRHRWVPGCSDARRTPLNFVRAMSDPSVQALSIVIRSPGRDGLALQLHRFEHLARLGSGCSKSKYFFRQLHVFHFPFRHPAGRRGSGLLSLFVLPGGAADRDFPGLVHGRFVCDADCLDCEPRRFPNRRAGGRPRPCGNAGFGWWQNLITADESSSVLLAVPARRHHAHDSGRPGRLFRWDPASIRS